MQKLVLYSTLCLILLAACSKDKFQDKPSIEIKSINPTQVPLQNPLEMTFTFTDKQGDLDSIFLWKVRLNSAVKPITPANYFNYKLPDFPEKNKGDIKVTLQYNTDLITAVSPNPQPGAPNDKEPDTILFKVILKDKAHNVSDTATTDKIVIERY
jgi:hypothetical protein